MNTPLPTRVWKHRSDLPLFLSAAAWLFLAWLTLDILPGKLYRKLLSPRLRTHPAPPDAGRIIPRVQWAITTAARRTPWRTVCFHEGIAAQRLLCARGIPADLHFGVARSDDAARVESHVWVDAAGRTVVGEAAQPRFTRIHTYRPSS